MQEDVFTQITEFADELTEIRRDLHMHPEIGFQEVRTSGIVAEYLEKLGVEVHRNIGGTGVVGVLNGKSSGRTIGLRADMDALPIDEQTNLPWSSKTPGVMHACGHDAHTSMLLGAARHLSENQDFAGTAVFIFQPAEEGQGGARAMLADGLFDQFPCDEIYALHNDPNGRLGEFVLKPGIAYAGADFFDITIEGVGAHAAYPQKGTDNLGAAAALIQAFNAIPSRTVPASERLVLSITQINAGTAYNILPQTVSLAGTMRFCDDDTAEIARNRMDAIARGIDEQFDVSVKLVRDEVFSVLNNDKECGDAAIEVAKELVGDQAVVKPGADMGSEDFADMLHAVPGAYLILGHNKTVPVHNPGFDIDDEILPYGAAFFSKMVRTRGMAVLL